jgi:GNAT superfamily N-acetyltransferase
LGHFRDYGRNVIRSGTPEDAEAVARVHVESWDAAYDLVGPTYEQRVEMHRNYPPIVAEVDGSIVGFVGVGPSRDPDAEGELYTIYVHPSRWGSGVGRELLAAGEDRMLELGYRYAILWVLETNPRARRFYEATGWTLDGRRRPITVGGVDVPEVRYAKTLGGVEGA